MSKNVIQYGKVSFTDICVGSIVEVVDCDDNVAVEYTRKNQIQKTI